METKNHLHLAKFIGTSQNLGKHSRALCLGSVMPDLNLLSHLRGHTYKDSIQLIKDKASSLIKQPIWNNSAYFEFGMILHYVADYFTFPHNENFHGNFSKHLQYERSLHIHFTQYLKMEYANLYILELNNKNKYSIPNLFSQEKPSLLNNNPILSSISDMNVHSLSDLFDMLEEKHHAYCLEKPSYMTDCNYIFSFTNFIAYSLPQLRKQLSGKTIFQNL